MISRKEKKAIGNAARRVAGSARSYDVLPSGTWLEGGCGIFARAIQKAIRSSYGVSVNLCALRGGELEMVQHILVRIGDCYYDADGMSTEEELLERWENLESVKHPKVGSLDIWPEEIVRDEGASRFIAGMLLKRLSKRTDKS